MAEQEYLSTDPNFGTPMRPVPARMFGKEPMTGREFLEADAANRQRVSDLAAEHPIATGVGLAAVGGAPMLARSVMGRGAGLAATAASVAAPYAKYYGVKHALLSVGVPAPAAEAMAIAASGYSRGAKTPAPEPTARPAAAAEAAPAAPVEPPASSPATPAPSAAPSVPAAAPVRPAGSTPSPMSPQMVQNQLGIQARRQGVTLTEPQYKAATEMVKQGATPADAVKEVASRVQATPPAAAPATPAETPATPSKAKVPKRAKLTADEADEYLRLTGKGMSNDEAVEALMAQRKLAAKLGTPEPEAVRRRVAERNVRGKWPE